MENYSTVSTNDALIVGQASHEVPIMRMSDILEWAEASIPLGEEVGFVDTKDIDLMSEYNRLNKILYDGKLGVHPIKWNKRKDAGALVKFSHRRKSNGEVEITGINGIEVSTFYSQTTDALRDRLAHEMIHVYWLEKGVMHSHDKYFKSEMDRINRMNAGVVVSKEEKQGDVRGVGGAAKSSGQRVVVVLRRGKTTSIVVFSSKDYRDKVLQVYSSMTYSIKSKRMDGIEVYKHDSSWLSLIPVARKFTRNTRMFNVKEADLADLRKNGIKIGHMSIDGFDIDGTEEKFGDNAVAPKADVVSNTVTKEKARNTKDTVGRSIADNRVAEITKRFMATMHIVFAKKMGMKTVVEGDKTSFTSVNTKVSVFLDRDKGGSEYIMKGVIFKDGKGYLSSIGSPDDYGKYKEHLKSIMDLFIKHL